MLSHTHYSYPSHHIHPSLKDESWIRQYIEAAWHEADSEGKTFYSQAAKFHEILQYARGKQSVNQYKEQMGVDLEEDESWIKLDLRVLPIAAKFRRLALGKLNKVEYNVLATPIDQLAKSEQEKHFNEIRSRILMRQEFQGSPLSGQSLLQKNPGEPEDLEEFEMQARFTNKHNMAIEAETALEVVLNENRYKEISRRIKKDLFDFGVAGIREYIDHNERVRIRHISPFRLISSYCEHADFSDLSHIGEVEDMTIGELKDVVGDKWTGEDWKKITEQCLGKYGNSREIPPGRDNQPGEDNLKVRVVHLEFMTVNDYSFDPGPDPDGNPTFSKPKEGETGSIQRSAKVLYKGSLVIGTPYLYNAGKVENQKRKKGSLHETTFSYHLYAPDMYDMEPLGIMEQIIPVVNQIQVLWLKLQNVIAEARPKGIAIDFTAIESVPLGEGGEVMDPEDVVDMFLQKGVLVYRRYDPKSGYSSAKPIEELENGVGKDATFYYGQIINNIQLIRDISGLNELTDGSTPDARTLTSVAAMAQEGSNNALYYILDGERDILERACGDMLLRIQDIIQNGKGYDGYKRSLGTNSVEYWKASEKLPAHVFGINLEIRPDEMARQRLLEYATKYAGDGGLQPEDIFLIESTDNLKQAQEILSYRFSKRRKETQNHQMVLQRDRVEAEQQSAVAQEQERQRTAQLENELKKDLESHKKGLEVEFEHLRHKHRLAELELSAEKDQSMKAMDMARDAMGGA